MLRADAHPILMNAVTRIAVATTSATLLAFALVERSPLVGVLGAAIYLGSLTLQAWLIIHRPRRETGWAESISTARASRAVTTLSETIEATIVLCGLMAFLIGVDDPDVGATLVGGTISIGALAIWVIAALVFRELTGAPLRISRKGWHLDRQSRSA
jgi:hypothetical protein